MNDAKGLKPEMLEPTLPPLQMKDWYRKWENYQLAGGWGQGDNHRTQLAYLCTCVSDEIRTAINFDSVRTEQNALHQIKEYLDMAIMPLNLQRLEVLRYSLPTRQSQTVTTQTIVQMFREANGFDLNPNEVLIICLLNIIQDKNLMIRYRNR